MKKIAFKNIKTKLDLITRIVRDTNNNNILSTGNQLKTVLRFLDQLPLVQSGVQNIEVQVSFANRITGVDYATLYINIHDNLYNQVATMEQADLIRQLRSNEDNYIPEEPVLSDGKGKYSDFKFKGGEWSNEESIFSDDCIGFIGNNIKSGITSFLSSVEKKYGKIEESLEDEPVVSEAKQEEFNNKLAKLLISAFEEFENTDIKHTTFNENTTDEELCNVLGIDVEEFRARTGKEEMMRIPRCRVCTPNFTDEYCGFIGFESIEDFDIFNGVVSIEDYNEENTGVLIPSDRIIDLIHDTSPRIKISQEYKGRSIGVNSTVDSDESAGVLISSDSFKNKKKAISNEDAISLIADYDDEIAKIFNANDKLELRRKTEKELIKELEDEFIDNLANECLYLTRLLNEEVINFDQYSDTILKAVKNYNDTKESPEFKKELMRARMYDKFFSPSENLR